MKAKFSALHLTGPAHRALIAIELTVRLLNRASAHEFAAPGVV